MKKSVLITIILLLGMLISVPNIVIGAENTDSLVLERLFSYRRNFACEIEDTAVNVYQKLTIDTRKRNFTMMCVPTLFHIAYGDRQYIMEAYGRLQMRSIKDFDIKRQIYVSTVPHRSSTLTTLRNYSVPDIYGVSMFKGNVLSPFHRCNQVYYRYTISEVSPTTHLVTFKPRSNNTQLIKGFAIAETLTGRVTYARFQGEYDMLSFDIVTNYSKEADDRLSIMPQECIINTSFKFLGNDMKSTYTTVYGCNSTLPDSIQSSTNMELLNHIRPIPLDSMDIGIYTNFFGHVIPQDSIIESVKKSNNIAKSTWNLLEDNMLSSIRAENDKGYFRLSPLINPQYISYSNRRGFSYKLALGAEYKFNEKRKFEFNARIGYNFKIKQFYFHNNLHFDFNPKRNGWLELEIANGNRITNSSVLDLLQEQHRDTVDFSKLDLHYFNDNKYQLSCNIAVTDQFEVMPALVYHHRNAVNKEGMIATGQPTSYKGFAPSLTFKYHPASSWPYFTVNYERCIDGVLSSNMEYERWELDASYRRRYSSLKRFNARIGCGLYTNQSTTYFVDYINFHENYLPGGWDDDWTGEFQLLNSQWYNSSKYYLRANMSYDSPLLIMTRLPLAGRIIEAERLYFSFVQLEKTRPYFELGYGFTTRYVSLAFFSSFLNTSVKEFGTKFTFELFRKW